MTDPVAAACAAVEAGLADPRYAHTSAFRVTVDGRLVHAARYGGPEVAETFSVTKTVLATVAGTARLPDLDGPVDRWVHAACGVDLAATPAAGTTWRQLLTMTRGAAVEDFDDVAALPAGWVARIAAAPRDGFGFRYDNGGAHLLSAALTGWLGEPVDAVAERVLFRPYGITGARWRRDPDGIAVGAGFLRLSAAHLSALGQVWLDGGPMDPAFHAAMVRRQSPGGPPEDRGYGYLTWVDEDHFFAGGWAGQHVVVVPAARAVVVTTGHPNFRPHPRPADDLSPDWRPALDLVRTHLLPALQ